MNDEMNEKMTDRADRAVSRQVPAARVGLLVCAGARPAHWRWSVFSFSQFHIISVQPLEQLRMEVPLAVGSPELPCSWCLAPALRQ